MRDDIGAKSRFLVSRINSSNYSYNKLFKFQETDFSLCDVAI